MTNPKYHELIIVIPCYNEENRIDLNAFQSSLKLNPKIAFIFSDDGSTDKTLEKINSLKADFFDRVFVLSSVVNQGKAAAVRKGVLYSFEEKISFSKIAYLDADLATSIKECYEISKWVEGKIEFAFGSRISKIDNTISRKLHRHFIGRFVSTLISNTLQLTVYDTQCGCKVFSKSFAEIAFKEVFISKWLFDVEIFFRAIDYFGRGSIIRKVREIPLKSWIDVGDSKVKFNYFFVIWYDLLKIRKRYKR